MIKPMRANSTHYQILYKCIVFKSSLYETLQEVTIHMHRVTETVRIVLQVHTVLL